MDGAMPPLPFSISGAHRETCRLIEVLKSVHEREEGCTSDV